MRTDRRVLGSLVAVVTAVAAFVSIGASPASASGPTAGLSIQPAGGLLTVKLVADSTGFASPVTSYTWDFGDGEMTTTTVKQVTHTYPNASTFMPSVTEIAPAGQTAMAIATLALFLCAAPPRCTEALTDVGNVQSLKVSGPIPTGASPGLNLLAGSFKIKNCEASIEPAVAFTDQEFTGNLTATVTYTTSQPASVGTTCFASTVAFKNSIGVLVKSGALPKCMVGATNAPCVRSIKQSGALVTKVLVVPPNDPKVGVP
jgi:PKD repeat protein